MTKKCGKDIFCREIYKNSQLGCCELKRKKTYPERADLTGSGVSLLEDYFFQ